MTRTDCDLIAKDVNVRVFMSKAGNRGKILVFRYDPVERWVGPQWVTVLPTLRFSEPGVLLVSIPEVSSVIQQLAEWDGVSIRYDIGAELFPSTRVP
jgi:hypothetical protein